ncbi:serine/arginine repetitive matrix protein 2-like, partial [Diaphorina citri]|uniref:Serine/arginine repetitive matrix protein 2-like n=1 Tax=Diaphorina citri TaxID=121845 RepID=A0A3Q0JJ07_DIACI
NGKHKILPFVNCYVCGKQMHTDSFQHHIRSRKHQKLLHEAQDLAKFWIKVIGNSSVFFKEDIIRSIFEKHGKILRIAFQNNAFFIRFLKVKSVVHALDRQHYKNDFNLNLHSVFKSHYKNDFNLNIRVMPLYIQPQHPMEVDVFQVEPENNESDDFRRILSTTIESIQHRTISQLVTFDSIANEIVLSVLSRADNESGSGQVYAELQRMFSAWCASVLRDHGISVKVHVYVFGSIEIGLSLSRYSDIDVYVDVDTMPCGTSSDSVQNPSSRSTIVQNPFSGSVNVQNPSNSPPVQNPTSLNVQNTSTSCNNVQNTTSESTNESSDSNSNPLLAMFSNIALSCPGSQAPSSDKPSNDPPTSRLSNGPITSPSGMQSFAAMFPAGSVAPMAAFPVNRLPFPGTVTPVFRGPAGVFPGMVAFPEHRMPFVSTPAGMFPGTATIPGTTSAPLFPVASSNVFPGSPVSSSPQSSTSSSSSVMETLKLLAYHSPQSRIQTDLRSKDVTDIENQLLGTVQQSENNQTNRLHHSHSISNSIESNESRNQAKLPASHSCDLSSSSNQAINSGNVSTRSVSSSGNTSLPDIEAQLQRLKLMMGRSGRQQSGNIVPLPRPNPGDTSRVNFIDVSDLENTLRLSRDVSENGTSSSDPDSSTKKSWDSRSTSSASGHSKHSATQRGVHASNTSSQPGHSLSSAGSNSRISTGKPKDRPSHVKHKPNRTQDTSDSHRNSSHDITNRDNPRIRNDPRDRGDSRNGNDPRNRGDSRNGNDPRNRGDSRNGNDPRNRDDSRTSSNNPRTKDNPRIRDDPRTSSETPRHNSASLKSSSGKPSNSKPVTLPVKQEQDIHRNDNSVHKKRSESHQGTLNGEQNSATKQLPLAAKQIPPTSKQIPPSKQLPPFTKQRSPVNRNVSTTKHPPVSNQPSSSSVPAHVSTSPPMLNGPSPSHPHPKDQTYRIQTRTVDNKRSVIIVIYPPAGTHLRDRAFFDIVNSVLTDYLTKVCRVEIHCKRYVNAWEFLLQGTHKLDVCQKRNKLLKEVGFSPPRSLNHSKFQVEILKTNFLLMNARESLSENQFVVSLSCLGATGSGETQVILKNENGKQETSQYLSFLAFLQNAFDVIYKEMMQRCHQINR